MVRNSADKVVRRRVFYIHGFDPFPARRYRELYRKEAQAQAEISGYRIAVTSEPGTRAHGWLVEAEMDGVTCQTEIEVLIWSDIVSHAMPNSIFQNYWALLGTVYIYFKSGTIFRLVRMRKGPIIAAFYPVFFMLVQLVVSLLLAGLALSLVGAFHPVLGMLGAVFIFVAVMQVFQRLDRRIYARYLMQDYAFSACEWGAYPAELQARLDQFRDRIAGALASDVDEVLVVGHSSGVHFGVSVLADLLRRGRPEGAALSFLSLGQAVPMVSFLPRARELRRDLAAVSCSGQLTWVDVSAPGDGCCFALCDPVTVTGVAPASKRWPLVLSAAFSQTLSAERWRTLRWRFFRLHFQYLCAFDRPGWYDYFAITAGPLTLAARVRGKVASKSRIETPLSGYTDMAP